MAKKSSKRKQSKKQRQAAARTASPRQVQPKAASPPKASPVPAAPKAAVPVAPRASSSTKPAASVRYAATTPNSSAARGRRLASWMTAVVAVLVLCVGVAIVISVTDSHTTSEDMTGQSAANTHNGLQVVGTGGDIDVSNLPSSGAANALQSQNQSASLQSPAGGNGQSPDNLTAQAPDMQPTTTPLQAPATTTVTPQNVDDLPLGQ
jgi:hypothetical protein